MATRNERRVTANDLRLSGLCREVQGPVAEIVPDTQPLNVAFGNVCGREADSVTSRVASAQRFAHRLRLLANGNESLPPSELIRKPHSKCRSFSHGDERVQLFATPALITR